MRIKWATFLLEIQRYYFIAYISFNLKIISNYFLSSGPLNISCYMLPIQSYISFFKQEQQQQQDEVLSKEARMARVHRVASELLSTEEQYVTVLYLIDQVGGLLYLTYTIP